MTRKDHFHLPFIDQMLERLASHAYYCFLDGYSGYNQIPIAPEDKKRLPTPAPLGHLPTIACHLVYVMLLVHFKGA